ncbi:hypothetical protein E4U54_004545 [Claviceps lovelessii]|nr:hypothetical protein E4U54_004545 [Claviceps lovelessii]
MAFETLTDPCLPYFFSEGYTPLPGLVAMVSAIMVVGVESYLTARGAGHSHSHAHDFFDHADSDGDGDFQTVPLHDQSGMLGRRNRSHRLGGFSPDDHDAEASQGLVAGVSPLPESTPIMATQKRKSSENGYNDADADADADADSDLDIDMEELDPATVGSVSDTNNRDEVYASLAKPDRRADVSDPTMLPKTPDQVRRQLLQCVLLEAGILFHSVFIGMAISVATGPAFVVFLVAISFHQSFEGLALGSRIAAIQFPKNSIRPWLMVLAYGLTTPLGQAIGLAVHKMYDPTSMGGLLVVGFMNAISSGLLLYAGLVQLLAEDFLTEKSYRVLRGTKRLQAYMCVVSGALLMALVGAFA